MDLCNPAVIREVMGEAGIVFRREFGQNFLINPTVPQRIAESCADDGERMVLEIGPGIGCLTNELAQRYRKVVAVEIDRGLIPVLQKTLAEYDNVTVINEDVLKLPLASFVKEQAQGLPVSVCANLPYYITTPILMALVESGVGFDTVTVMVQQEVAARLTAEAGSADYGAITAVLGYYAKIKRLFTVPAGCFMPAPKVNSAVIRMDLYREPPCVPKDKAFFFGIIRAAFGQRRKTLVNALHAAYGNLEKEQISAALRQAGFSETVRGEKLSTADFARLSDILWTEMHKA